MEWWLITLLVMVSALAMYCAVMALFKYVLWPLAMRIRAKQGKEVYRL